MYSVPFLSIAVHPWQLQTANLSCMLRQNSCARYCWQVEAAQLGHVRCQDVQVVRKVQVRINREGTASLGGIVCFVCIVCISSTLITNTLTKVGSYIPTSCQYQYIDNLYRRPIVENLFSHSPGCPLSGRVACLSFISTLRASYASLGIE